MKEAGIGYLLAAVAPLSSFNVGEQRSNSDNDLESNKNRLSLGSTKLVNPEVPCLMMNQDHFPHVNRGRCYLETLNNLLIELQATRFHGTGEGWTLLIRLK
ncbi:hypothetical protein POM88_019888 [Heracleum sosnowskyi]|uniref:Uncharacterized protein n=1 Tax=Heracleum sosnowskyi TaxID=360622 RepID=A0AAD8ID08_9APIA|nr:hypothetical protein POM88_019888 [Heracleum sosnowskyi]